MNNKKSLFSFFAISLFVLASNFLVAQTNLPDNDKHVGMFSINNQTRETSVMPEPSEYWTLFEADSSYLGSTANGDVAIFYGVGHTTLVNPVIIVDGFDPGDHRPIEGLYEIGNQQNMIDSLRAIGEDFILLNFKQGADYIQRNAMLVVSLLDTIQTIMINNGTYLENPQIVVVGPSMGGLITRYALCYMEANNMNHHVRNWISFDAPHKGANIPLGLQHWLRFFAEVAESDGAFVGLASMNSIAAKQMLLYHYTATQGTLAGPNPLRYDLVNELAIMGFPVETRIVAVANGSGYGITQDFAAGEKVVEYEYSDWSVDLTGNVWAVPNQTSTRIFEGLYNTILPLDEVTESVYIENTLSYDNAPGGDTPTFLEIAIEDPGYGTIIALHEDHCFIPTISSLCITNTNQTDFNVNENLQTIVTPFDAIYYPFENQEHAEISAESYQWFKFEIHNYAPVFTSTQVSQVYANNSYSSVVTAQDSNYWNVLNYHALELPNWLSFDENSGALTGTPSGSDIGFNHVIISVSDGLLETVLVFDIEVLSNTNTNILENQQLNMFPNPVKDYLNILFSDNTNKTIEIFSTSGKLVYSSICNDSNAKIPCYCLSKGIYVIKVIGEESTIKSVFIKI